MLVAGTVALDLIARVPSLPVDDQAVRATDMGERFGGCAGNVARALGRLGHEPQLVSAVGAGFRGSAYEEALVADGVDLSDLLYHEQDPTARAFLATDPKGHQQIVYHEGATPHMTEIDLVAAPIGHFAPGELSTYPRLMEHCGHVTFDPGQETFHRDIETVWACVEATDILLANHHEAQRLADHAGGLDGLLGTMEALVVTDADGQELHTPEGTQRIPGVACDDIEHTGAGDAHSAGFVHGLAQGWGLEDCCRMGSVIAAFALEAIGAQEGLPRLEAALDRFEVAYGRRPAQAP